MLGKGPDKLLEKEEEEKPLKLVSYRRNTHTRQSAKGRRRDREESDQMLGEGFQLGEVVHSESLYTMTQEIHYIQFEETVPRTGIGMYFWIRKAERNEGKKTEIIVLSVDDGGPSDQGILRKGDKLVAVEGHGVEGALVDDCLPLLSLPPWQGCRGNP